MRVEKYVVKWQNKVQRIQKIESTFKLIVNLILILVILVNLILITKAVRFPNETPGVFGTKAFIVISRKYVSKHKNR